MGIKYIIKEVINNKTGKRDEQFGYRIGRQCEINPQQTDEGIPLIVYYPNGKYFATTLVQDIEEHDYGVNIKTKNRTYYFEHVV